MHTKTPEKLQWANKVFIRQWGVNVWWYVKEFRLLLLFILFAQAHAMQANMRHAIYTDTLHTQKMELWLNLCFSFAPFVFLPVSLALYLLHIVWFALPSNVNRIWNFHFIRCKWNGNRIIRILAKCICCFHSFVLFCVVCLYSKKNKIKTEISIILHLCPSNSIWIFQFYDYIVEHTAF